MVSSLSHSAIVLWIFDDAATGARRSTTNLLAFSSGHQLGGWFRHGLPCGSAL